MAGGIMLAFAIGFSFLGLVLVVLGFSTNHWIDVTVSRGQIDSLATFDEVLKAKMTSDANFFSRYRGIFKVCYKGNETFFLDNADDVDGNCQWIKGLLMKSDEETVDFEDEYDWRNHIIRSHMTCIAIGMVLLLIGAILSSCGCWKLSPRGFRLAGLIVFLSAFFVACGMACFHGYDYLEKEKIEQKQQGLFPKYWRSENVVDDNTRMTYGYSYIVTWVGLGLSATAGILLLCTASSISLDDDYNKYSEKKLSKKVNRILQTEMNNTPTTPPPSYLAGVGGQAKGPIIEVPVEVPVGVPVEDGGVYPVVEYGNTGYVMDGKAMSMYGADPYRPAYGPAPMPAGYAASSYGGYGPAAQDFYGGYM